MISAKVIIAIILVILGGLYYKKNAIYRTLRGEKGVKGEQGEQGIPGIQGAVGPAGPKGERGVPGAPGPIGITGLQGLKGVKGDQGNIGLTGPIGPAGVAGPIGPPGPRGNIGPQGVPGEKGDVGEMGKVGQSGPRGLAGPAGPIGPMGKMGKTGPMGKRGEMGPQGVPGAAGMGFTDQIRSMIDQHVRPYFHKQKCVSVPALSGKCPPNHFMSGLSGMTQDGRITKGTQMQCCYGIGGGRIGSDRPEKPPPGPRIRVVEGQPQGNTLRRKEKYTTFSEQMNLGTQTASNPNVLAANIKNMDLAARGLQLRNNLGTGRQTLVTTGNHPIISGGGNVLRVNPDVVSPALADRIRIASMQDVSPGYLSSGR